MAFIDTPRQFGTDNDGAEKMNINDGGGDLLTFPVAPAGRFHLSCEICEHLHNGFVYILCRYSWFPNNVSLKL